jgi:hypothetical protein
MFDLMKQAIEVLKHKVALNLDEIRKNEIRFRTLLSQLKGMGDSAEMNKILELNKNLLSENFDFINLQISLLKFIEKHQKQQVLSSNENATFETDVPPEVADIFELTVSGSMAYNNEHPLFFDDDFYNRLMKYFEEKNDKEQIRFFLQAKSAGHAN